MTTQIHATHGSRGFQKIPIYLTADMGYRFRNFSVGSDDLPWNAEGGYSFYFDRMWFSASSTVNLGVL